MNHMQSAVEDFHDKFGLPVRSDPEFEDRELRAKLIMEEAVETCAAMGFHVSALIDEDGIPGVRPHREIATFSKSYTEPDFVETIDGLCDLLYVTFGAASTFGIDIEDYYEEVHRSNMDKDGGGKRADGKILKPEGWKPPDILSLLQRDQHVGQLWADLNEDMTEMEVIR